MIKRLCWLVLIFSVGLAAGFCANLDLYADSDKTAGLDFKFLLGEFRFSVREDKFNVGISATSDKFAKKIPFTLKTGNLSTGGSLSKLNNPLLSTSTSPFSTGISSLNCITASLPGFTAFSKPMGVFFQIGNKNQRKNPFLWKSSCLYVPEEQSFVSSIFTSLKLFKKSLLVSSALTAGVFPYSENTSSSWFVDELYYSEGSHFCSLCQISASYKNLYSAFSAGIYETPFGTMSCLFRTDNKITTRRFIISFSALQNQGYGENVLITSSDKTIPPCTQFRAGLQYKFLTGTKLPVFVKTGIAAYGSVSHTEDEHKAKLGAGVQAASSLFSLSLTGAANGVVNTENLTKPAYIFDSASVKLKNSWYIADFTPSVSVSETFNPSDDFTSITNTLKFTAGLNYAKFPKITSSASYALTNKDGEYTSKKIAATVTSKFTFKYVTCIIKLSADFEL